MTGEIRNPAKLPTDLTPAEKKFARCLAEGKFCTVGNGKLPEKEIKSGNDANVVRVEVIRFFAFGGNEENPVIGPRIHLEGAWILGYPNHSDILDLGFAHIHHALLLCKCHFTVQIVMLDAECFALDMRGSCLSDGMFADGLKVKGSFMMREEFVSKSTLRLNGAQIGSDLDCRNSYFAGEKIAIRAERAKIGGSIQFDGSSAEGDIMLDNTHIGGNLTCANGTFSPRTESAIHATGINVEGSVLLNRRFEAKGEVRLLNARVGENLSCSHGMFGNYDEKEKGHALSADNINVEGNVFMRHVRSRGQVRFLGAQIRGDLECTGGIYLIDKLDEGPIRAENAEIGKTLTLERMAGCGTINLASTKTNDFKDGFFSDDPFKWHLDGFIYDRFANPITANAPVRVRWLAKRCDGATFSPQPYEQAAKVLFRMGHDRDAREILLKKERLQTTDKRTTQPRKFLRWSWDVFAGYGYRLRYTAMWMTFFVLFGAFLFYYADESGRIVPHQPIVLTNFEYKSELSRATGDRQCRDGPQPTKVVARMFPDYPEFNALVYSADVFIPFFALHQEPYWYPKPHEMDRGFILWFLPLWYWLEIIAGWVLTSLFLLSVTGLLRPRQSSGEKD